MSSAPVFTIKYWGATGSMAAPLRPAEISAKLRDAIVHLDRHGRLGELASVAKNPAKLAAFLDQHLPFHLRSSYGGNTTCLEIQTPDALLIIDGGTGFRELGAELERRWNVPGFAGPREAHVIFSHAHMDHTLAMPFFDPYMDPRNNFILYCSAAVMKSFDAVLSPEAPLSRIYVPVTFDLFKAIRRRVILDGKKSFTIGQTTVTIAELNHPGGCLGFRFDCQGRSFVFCTDHEQTVVPDPLLTEFARGADLLYVDGQYLAAEYEGRAGIMGEAPMSRRGWGHSTVEACVTTAVAAGVKQMHLGHREPKRDDADLARLEAFAGQCLAEAGPNTAGCRVCIPFEGMVVEL